MAWYEKGSILDKLVKSIDGWIGKQPTPKFEGFENLTKVELEEYGRTIGIELDRRKTKANMIQDLNDFTNK
tara:strand:+ start:722 stop:934 length:213 start_codon:yes stop_codon:yes gene_type:complete